MTSVFLVDDNALTPFWCEPGFLDKKPGDWTVHKLTPPNDGGGDLVEQFVAKVTATAENPFYVVTDARFGHDRSAGCNLLAQLRNVRGFVRGVVYSTDPNLPGADEKLAPVEAGEDGPGAVWAFLRYGTRPPTWKRQMFGRARHALKDAAYPIRLDIQTLNGDPEQFDSIREDYFGGDGYLTAQRHFPWTPGDAPVAGLEALAGAVLGPLRPPPDKADELQTALSSTLQELRSRQPDSAGELSEALGRVLEALDALQEAVAGADRTADEEQKP